MTRFAGDKAKSKSEDSRRKNKKEKKDPLSHFMTVIRLSMIFCVSFCKRLQYNVRVCRRNRGCAACNLMTRDRRFGKIPKTCNVPRPPGRDSLKADKFFDTKIGQFYFPVSPELGRFSLFSRKIPNMPENGIFSAKMP